MICILIFLQYCFKPTYRITSSIKSIKTISYVIVKKVVLQVWNNKWWSFWGEPFSHIQRRLTVIYFVGVFHLLENTSKCVCLHLSWSRVCLLRFHSLFHFQPQTGSIETYGWTDAWWLWNKQAAIKMPIYMIENAWNWKTTLFFCVSQKKEGFE